MVDRSFLKHALDLLSLECIPFGLIVVVCFPLYYWLCSSVPEQFIISAPMRNMFYDTDPDHYYKMMTNRASDSHVITRKHPLISIILYVPTRTLLRLGVPFKTASNVILATVAVLSFLVFYSTLRALNLSLIDALMMTALFASSATAIHFFVVPESYGLSSLSVLLGFFFAALISRNDLSDSWYVVMNLSTSCITITNWSIGLIITALNKPIKTAIKIYSYTLSIMVLAWAVQKRFFPMSVSFLESAPEDAKAMLSVIAGGPIAIMRSFFLYSVVLPPAVVVPITAMASNGGTPSLSVQKVPLPVGGEPLLIAGLLGWAILLMIGAMAAIRPDGQVAKFRLVLVLCLVVQILISLIFGFETFLYSLHFVPMLMFLASFGLTTRFRLPLRIGLALLIPVIFINNLHNFWDGIRFLNENMR